MKLTARALDMKFSKSSGRRSSAYWLWFDVAAAAWLVGGHRLSFYQIPLSLLLYLLLVSRIHCLLTRAPTSGLLSRDIHSATFHATTHTRTRGHERVIKFRAKRPTREHVYAHVDKQNIPTIRTDDIKDMSETIFIEFCRRFSRWQFSIWIWFCTTLYKHLVAGVQLIQIWMVFFTFIVYLKEPFFELKF